MECGNENHASLACTGWDDAKIHDKVDESLLKLRKGSTPYLDIDLWRSCPDRRLTKPEPRMVVGMKGLPGRVGIGVGHQKHKSADPDLLFLRELIQADAGWYEKFYRP